MNKNKLFVMFVMGCMLLSACLPPQGQSRDNGAQPSPQAQSQPQPAATQAEAVTESASSNQPHHSDVDLTHLEIGSGKASNNPQVGYVYSCRGFDNVGGNANGTWFNSDGTWDATKKLTVDGTVNWQSNFTVKVEGNQRVFTTNNLPNHPTGIYPISPSDDAYQFDRNPGSITDQSIQLSLPANPSAATQPNCIGGEVGILLSGVVLFNAFDADGRDAPANEIQDDCDGHPQNTGVYHYHNLSDCLEDISGGHSALMGYAFDGFGIFGYYGEDGGEMTNADLDECHGHTHAIEWDGSTVEMYHYHATHQFPYVVGCFHGTSSQQGPIGGGAGAQQGQDQPQPATGGAGQQPPQAALDACINLTANSACTFTTPIGILNGACMPLPISSQLACVPAVGAPP